MSVHLFLGTTYDGKPVLACGHAPILGTCFAAPSKTGKADAWAKYGNRCKRCERTHDGRRLLSAMTQKGDA